MALWANEQGNDEEKQEHEVLHDTNSRFEKRKAEECSADDFDWENNVQIIFFMLQNESAFLVMVINAYKIWRMTEKKQCKQ